ncbi:MAG: hypothetical protein GY937_22840 [bacterium]|nr:hypothetical protein [bacterium]
MNHTESERIEGSLQTLLTNVATLTERVEHALQTISDLEARTRVLEFGRAKLIGTLVVLQLVIIPVAVGLGVKFLGAK